MFSEWNESLADALAAPFDVTEIAVRAGATTRDKQAAQVLVYLDATAVATRLDRIVGPGGWQDRLIVPTQPNRIAYVCELTILGVTKSDVGEGAKESEPDKSAASDAFKRAARKFGVGRYLVWMPYLNWPYDADRRRFVDEGELLRKAYELSLAVHQSGPDASAIDMRAYRHNAGRHSQPQRDQRNQPANGAPKGKPDEQFLKKLRDKFGKAYPDDATRREAMHGAIGRVCRLSDIDISEAAKLMQAANKQLQLLN